MKKIINLHKALSDPNRLRILKMLQKKELCVCEITDVLGLAASTVSKHLSVLSSINLIVDRKDGRWINYRLNDKLDNYSQAILENTIYFVEEDEKVKSDNLRIKNIDRMVICGVEK